MITQTYELYLINNNVYINYESEKFDRIEFENKINLIRFGYEKSSDDTDYYLIDINNKIRQASLYSYPKITVTLNLLQYNKNNDITKSYPYHGKNTTIVKENDIFVENTNIFPKYFVLNKNNKMIINTIIKYDKKNLNLNSLIYSQIFHLRLHLIKTKYDIDDYLNDNDNTQFIEYSLGQTQFTYDYYGNTKKIIQLFDENLDPDYNDIDDIDDIDNIDNIDDNSNEDEYLPEIVKLNVNLTNKILELEQQIKSLKSNTDIKYNNHHYQILELNKKHKDNRYILMIYFIFFLIQTFFYYL